MPGKVWDEEEEEEDGGGEMVEGEVAGTEVHNGDSDA